MKLKSMNYIGPSMNPTLEPGDRLRLVPYDEKEIRRGDVIVFIPPGADSKIIHRVIHIDSQGIKTRGDSCNQVDPWILSPDRVLGRVICAEEGDRRRRIYGGAVGRLYAGTIKAIHAIDSGVSSMLRPAYDSLARAGIFRRILPARVKTRVIFLNRATGTEMQLLMGRRVIGRWLPEKSGWHIRRPFRLFVDEASLPENKAEVSGVRFQVSGANKDI